MVGGNFQTSNRGIESDNLENNFANNSWCVTDINLTQVPFRYYNFWDFNLCDEMLKFSWYSYSIIFSFC